MLVIGLGSAAVAEPKLPSLPPVVGERAAPLNWSGLMDRPDAHSSGMALRRQAGAAVPVLELAYDLATAGGKAWVDLPGAALDGAPERLRLWIEGDGSGHRLEITYLYGPTQAWQPLAELPLDFTGWRHLEIPAGNPIHLYHKAIPCIRVTVAGQQGSGVLRVCGAQWVSPVLLSGPLPPARPQPTIFNTWGGADQQQLVAARSAGINLHLAPVAFPDRPVAPRVEYPAKAVRWARESGMLAGLAYYGTGRVEWLKEHADLLCMNAQGERYKRSGGAFMSPWHPAAVQIWRDHIVQTLQALKEQGALQHVDVVELCPGEEGEVSFEWSHVWAFDEYAQAAYRKYLAELYANDIAALNRDWGTAHTTFAAIAPPAAHYPDREHWVFTDFYRLSMLRQCVMMADAVQEVFTPPYWLWMAHSIGNTPQRFYSARFPHFYLENLRRLGYADMAHIAGLEWQMPEDIQVLRQSGLHTICEIDIQPTPERLKWTFGQAQKFGFDGVFVGVAEPLSAGGTLTSLGELCRDLIQQKTATTQRSSLP